MIEVNYIIIGIFILAVLSIIGLVITSVVDSICRNRFRNSIIRMDLFPGDKICIKMKLGYTNLEQAEGLKYRIADWAGILPKDVILMDSNAVQQLIILKEGMKEYDTKSNEKYKSN